MPSPNDFEFMRRFHERAASELTPNLKPGETAVEALKRMENEKVKALSERAQQENTKTTPPTPPVQEVVFYKGYKLNRDFFTCIAISLLELHNPAVKEVFETFGFELKDLNGKPVVLKQSKRKQKK